MSSNVEFTRKPSQLQRVKEEQSGSAMALGSHSPALRDGGTVKVMGEGLLAKSTPQFLSLTIINFQQVIGPVDITLRKMLSKAFSEATPYWEAMHLRIREVQTHLAIRFCPSSSSLCIALYLCPISGEMGTVAAWEEERSNVQQVPSASFSIHKVHGSGKRASPPAFLFSCKGGQNTRPAFQRTGCCLQMLPFRKHH